MLLELKKINLKHFFGIHSIQPRGVSPIHLHVQRCTGLDNELSYDENIMYSVHVTNITQKSAMSELIRRWSKENIQEISEQLRTTLFEFYTHDRLYKSYNNNLKNVWLFKFFSIIVFLSMHFLYICFDYHKNSLSFYIATKVFSFFSYTTLFLHWMNETQHVHSEFETDISCQNKDRSADVFSGFKQFWKESDIVNLLQFFYFPAHDGRTSLFKAAGGFSVLTARRIKLNTDCMAKYDSYQLVYSAIHSY